MISQMAEESAKLLNAEGRIRHPLDLGEALDAEFQRIVRKRMTPSYIVFTDSGPLLGTNPSNTVFDFFTSSDGNSSTRQFSRTSIVGHFSLCQGRTEAPKLPCKAIENSKHSPWRQTILSILLAKLKHLTEAFLGQTVDDAVLTVPSHSPIHNAKQ
ncbi:hypothetical protein niasHT_010924 [Heterodera trifolii]|uniref:Uncharacterized protein n=1 Tax=Heterodera trifolii TaxID=157864 RepID=A0ABD2LFW2_9BILA